MVYAASIRSCRPCPLREQCQWQGSATKKPRQVSILLHPLQVGSAPLLWKDWSRRQHRRACMNLLRQQQVEVTLPQSAPAEPHRPVVVLSRAQRAHYRLSWDERLACNAPASTTGRPTIKQIARPSKLCSLPRATDSVRRPEPLTAALFSDRSSSPRGPLWPFFLAFPRFLSSAAVITTITSPELWA